MTTEGDELISKYFINTTQFSRGLSCDEEQTTRKKDILWADMW
jgi:hypothetical protein